MALAKCAICATSLKIPACCSKDMVLDENRFLCGKCGKEVRVPRCCGNQLLALTI